MKAMRALLVGVGRYRSVPRPQPGAPNDVALAAEKLVSAGLDAGSITTLLDDQASCDAVRSHLRQLMTDAGQAEAVYFHYSGYGVQLFSEDPERPNVVEQAICPFDYDNLTGANALRDHELRDILASLPATASFKATFDCCYAGDFLDGSAERGLASPAASIESSIPMAHAQQLLAPSPSGRLMVSACGPRELAHAAEYDGKPYGVFSFHFYGAGGWRTHSVRAVVESIVPTLREHEQSPTLEGAGAMAARPFVE